MLWGKTRIRMTRTESLASICHVVRTTNAPVKYQAENRISAEVNEIAKEPSGSGPKARR